MVNKYYQKHKEKLRKEVHTRCQNLSEEENDKRRKGLVVGLVVVTILRSCY